MTTAASRIVALRRRARRLGFEITKTRARYWRVDNHLGWQITNADGAIVAGLAFEFTIEEVERFLDKAEAEARGRS